MVATRDMLQDRWLEVKDRLRQHWGKLSDDDEAALSGRPENLVTMLQRRYGYGKAQAQMEIDKWLDQCAAADRP